MKHSNHKVWLQVTCTEEERDKIQAAALKCHMNTGDYILDILKKEISACEKERSKPDTFLELSQGKMEKGQQQIEHDALG